MNVLALCAGAGGLELGVELALPEATPVCYVEREAYAAACLVARMAEGSLAQAPVWSDVLTFEGAPWRGVVDLVTAGYPCQGESDAGLRRGTDDERWLWNDVWRIVREVGAGYLFVENVAAHVNRSFRHVLGDLAAGGWAAEWDCVPAVAVGAPHIRDRIFCLAAHPDSAALRIERGRGEPGPGQILPGPDGAERTPSDADGHGREGERVGGLLDGERATCGNDADGCRGPGDAPNPNRLRLEARSEGGPSARGRAFAGGRTALDPASPGGQTGRRIELPRSGSEAWGVNLRVPQPVLRGVDDGLACGMDMRRKRLHVSGNGVVPQAAARAFRLLWRRLHG